jgi:hypothetical protein
VILDADVTNSSFWSYNDQPPDPTKMKQKVFVIESFFNHPTGTFYIDDIHFVDADDSPFDPDQHTDDEFLELVSQKTFLYFLDWYDPNTGLFQDRSTFPDLMSTAATGFGLTALAIGEHNGWISRTRYGNDNAHVALTVRWASSGGRLDGYHHRHQRLQGLFLPLSGQ